MGTWIGNLHVRPSNDSMIPIDSSSPHPPPFSLSLSPPFSLSLSHCPPSLSKHVSLCPLHVLTYTDYVCVCVCVCVCVRACVYVHIYPPHILAYNRNSSGAACGSGHHSRSHTGQLDPTRSCCPVRIPSCIYNTTGKCFPTKTIGVAVGSAYGHGLARQRLDASGISARASGSGLYCLWRSGHVRVMQLILLSCPHSELHL